MPYQVSMMGWVGLGRVETFVGWVGSGFEIVTHDQLCSGHVMAYMICEQTEHFFRQKTLIPYNFGVVWFAEW